MFKEFVWTFSCMQVKYFGRKLESPYCPLVLITPLSPTPNLRLSTIQISSKYGKLGFYMLEMYYRSARHQINVFCCNWSENVVFVTCFSCTSIQNFCAPALHRRSFVIGQNFGRGEGTEPGHGATAHPRPPSVKTGHSIASIELLL